MKNNRRKLLMAGAMAPVAMSLPGRVLAQASDYYKGKTVIINIACIHEKPLARGFLLNIAWFKSSIALILEEYNRLFAPTKQVWKHCQNHHV